MTTYRKIHGRSIQAVTTDPTEDVAEGQLWYNTTTDTFKSVLTSFAFRSTTSLPSGRDYGTGGGATQNASWVAGGEEGSTKINTTYDYNGSGWTQSGNMGDARIRMALGNMGPQTAGLGVGGYSPGIVTGVEEYDGSTWTSGTSLPGALQQAGGAGPQTANIILGGGNPTTSLSYNGSSWSSEGSSSEAFAYYGLAGANSEACLAFYGAEGPPGTNRTTGEEYNGTSWTTVVGTLPNQGNSGGATGTVTSAIFAGNSTTVRSYDGTSITLEPAMTQSRGNGYIGGTATSGITSGGSAPGSTANCEEFDKSINTITAAAWASGGALTAGARRGLASGKNSQTLTAGLVFGGGGNPYSGLGVKTEEYDGTSFTAGGDLNTYRYTLGGAGSQTAGLGFGGYVYPPAQSSNATEEYDGSSWTSVNNMSDARQSMGSFGTQTAAIATAGYSKPTTTVLNTTLSYDGTNWTALSSPANVNTTRSGLAGSGTQTAGLATGGNSSPYKQTEEWDGSAWTNQNSTINEHKNVINQQLGIQTNALICSGGPPNTTSTEGYDGTTWSTRPNMASARYEAAAGGSATSGFVAGGFTSTNVTTTEEFTGETTALNVKTLPQS